MDKNNQNNQNIPTTRAFNEGLRKLRVKDVPEVKAEIMQILGVSTRQSFARYASGRASNLDVTKAARIQEIFSKYGVPDCWGI